MPMADFVAWCADEREQVDQLRYFWHEPAPDEGLKLWSHAIAIDANGVDLQCSRFPWSPPHNMEDIFRFLDKLRRLIK